MVFKHGTVFQATAPSFQRQSDESQGISKVKKSPEKIRRESFCILIPTALCSRVLFWKHHIHKAACARPCVTSCQRGGRKGCSILASTSSTQRDIQDELNHPLLTLPSNLLLLKVQILAILRHIFMCTSSTKRSKNITLNHVDIIPPNPHTSIPHNHHRHQRYTPAVPPHLLPLLTSAPALISASATVSDAASSIPSPLRFKLYDKRA
jgi:hypothetical protein